MHLRSVLVKRVDAHGPEISKLRQQVAAQGDRFDRAIQKHEQEIAQMNSDLQAQGKGLADLQDLFEKADIQGLWEKVTFMDTKLVRHEELHTLHSKRLGSVEAHFKDLQKVLSQIA